MTRKVLVVDDSELSRDVVSAILGAHGYDVTAVAAGPALAESLERAKPDLVLFDEAVPARAMKLVELARARVDPACVIVLFADRPDVELAQLANATRASHFIRKGDARTLVKHVERLLVGQAD